MIPAVRKLNANDTTLLVIDLQDRLLAKMNARELLLRNSTFLIEVAQLLEIPVQATEQYPKGLGPTSPVIAKLLTGSIPGKTAFSCYSVPEVINTLQKSGRMSIVLIGIETHVCILQTGLDLLAAGFFVHIPIDIVASRFKLDHEVAIRRMELAGAVPTSAEAVAFEWLGDAANPRFKTLSQMIIQRSNSPSSTSE